MKKQLLFLSVTLFFLLCTTSVVGQERTNNEFQSVTQLSSKGSARLVTDNLTRSLRLSQKQQVAVYKLLQNVEDKAISVENIEDKQKKIDARAKVKSYIDTEMKNILTQEQFETYMGMSKRKN
ncbi:hypothetical protein [uncultured Psychroserpens sp.]|uniref:hypothetical protein n=1 Tax=uncultured Psychroserpens sp. TaxID=255436 RepID=UPI002637A705|nr:hypothetical protein [uncultured Psychroserpens sp.]